MALTNMESANGYLIAIKNNATATSEPRSKIQANDFENLKNISMDSNLYNIQSLLINPEVDTAIIDQGFVETGDELVIVKSDDSIHSIIVGQITETLENLNVVPAMTSTTEPSGVASNVEVFDGDNDTYSNAGNTSEITYEFPVPKVCVGVNVKLSLYELSSFAVTASNDGTTWVTLIADGMPNLPPDSTLGYIPFDFINTDSYKIYKLTTTRTLSSGASAQFYTIEYLSETQVHRIDTTAITAGETVTRCYLPSQTLKINNVDAVENETTRRVWAADSLVQKIDYAPLSLPPSPTLTLDVGLKSFWNKIVRIDVDIEN